MLHTTIRHEKTCREKNEVCSLVPSVVPFFFSLLFEQGDPHFHFAPDPANYIAGTVRGRVHHLKWLWDVLFVT